MTQAGEQVVKAFSELGMDGQIPLQELEREFRYEVINLALRMAQGNKCHAAKILGVHRNTLMREIDQMRAAGRLKYVFKPRYSAKKPPMTMRDVRRRIFQAGCDSTAIHTGA